MYTHIHMHKCMYICSGIDSLILFARYDDLCHSPRTNSDNSISTIKLVQSESSDLKKRQASNYSSVQGTFLYLYLCMTHVTPCVCVCVYMGVCVGTLIFGLPFVHL